jgi:hypothetical protein
MSGLDRRAVASGLCAIAIAMLLAGTSLSMVGAGPLDDVFAGVIVVPVAATVGALIFARVPGSPIGWIFLGLGLVGGLQSVLAGYADYSLPARDGSTLAEVSAWLTRALWAPTTLIPLTFGLLLFPDGRLPSRRWRPLPWLAAVGIGGLATFVALSPESGGPEVERWGLHENPYGLEEGDPTLALAGLLGVATLPAILGSVAALVTRFRRASSAERQQLKWLAYCGTVAVAVLLVAGTVFDEDVAAGVLSSLAFTLIPLSIGISILRYRLYDIDVVINRTLVYGALTATLAASYAGSVLLLQLALSPGSDLAIAGSTLAVAALFRPARGRIQAAVDRRFYRRKYDTARTLETFGVRLREEIDLEALAAELRGVVAETMQPAHVTLWLRAPEAR